MQKKRTIQSIDRAVEILDYISKNDNKVRLIDLSNDLEINKSTLHGILSTLEYNGLISKNQNTSKYSLGIKMYKYGKVYEQDFSLKKIVHPYIKKISEKFSESVHLGIESDYEVLYLDFVKSQHSIRLAAKVGNKDPLYCTAIGKVILANMSEDNMQYYLDNYTLEKFTENTIAEKECLLKELHNIRKQNYALDLEELELGLICVASPIRNNSGDLIAVIGISGPNNRISEDIFKEMKLTITKTANEISELLSNKNM
jgi:DNA-binding IclR family transcriptional regulator